MTLINQKQRKILDRCYKKAIVLFKKYGPNYDYTDEYRELIESTRKSLNFKPRYLYEENDPTLNVMREIAHEVHEEKITVYEFSIRNGKVVKKVHPNGTIKIMGKVVEFSYYRGIIVNCAGSCELYGIYLEHLKQQTANATYKCYSVRKDFDYESLVREVLTERLKSYEEKIAEMERMKSRIVDAMKSIS